VCFALSEMGVEGAGGGFIGERGCSGVCGVVVMEQVTRGSRCDGGEGGMVLLAVMATVGVLQRECGAVVGGGARMRGARMSGGVNDPDVCGLWFQESLPLCMVITPFVLFFCLL
jgi:hypothetical protein